MLLAIALIFSALCASSTIYKPPEPIQISPPVTFDPLYGPAAIAAGIPSDILRGIAITESNENDNAIGDDGISRGRMQLNSRYDDERARKWGPFNPFNAQDSVRIAALILAENYRAFGDWDLAIAAYRQGVRGVRENGPTIWYIRRVRYNACGG